MKTALIFCSLLVIASAVRAQTGGKAAEPPAAPPAPAESPRAAAGPAAPERAPQAAPRAPAAPGAAVSGPQAFWDWFVGAAGTPGAFKAPEMPCSLVHDLNGETSRSHKRKVEDRGQVYYAPFMLDLGANPKLCMYTDAPTIPAEAMLPMSPSAFNEWIADHDKDQSVRGPMLDYIKAATSTENPVARMTGDRAKFWRAALKAVLADDALRSSLCAKLQPDAPSCASSIGTKTPDELYALGRSAAH
jgi:hypothetical protein